MVGDDPSLPDLTQALKAASLSLKAPPL